VGEKIESRKYNAISQLFHWLMAFLIFGMLIAGFFMTGMEYGASKFTLYGYHKSFGTLVLILVVLRFIWKKICSPVLPLITYKSWEKHLSRAAHFLLYLLMFIMPASGWLMSSAGGFDYSFFGMAMPKLIDKNESLFLLFREIHEYSAILLLILISAHFLGAAKHHILDKDITLKRMLPEKSAARFAFLALLAGGAGLLFSYYFMGQYLILNIQKQSLKNEQKSIEVSELTQISAEDDLAPEWMINPDESKIIFKLGVYGDVFSGEFREFKGAINFDPENLVKSRAIIEVPIASVKSDSSERDTYILMPAWLNADDFPLARFVSKSFKKLEADKYSVSAELTLKGVTHEIEMPFHVRFYTDEENKQYALMQGAFSFDRTQYNIGNGEWAAPDTVGHQIDINVTVQAQKAQ
jgi:cytochrome b561